MAAARAALVGTEGEAEVVCSLLRASGVQCGWRVTDMSAPMGHRIMFEGWREVLVEQADVARAKEIIAAADSSD
jgi:hypothetical protein